MDLTENLGLLLYQVHQHFILNLHTLGMCQSCSWFGKSTEIHFFDKTSMIYSDRIHFSKMFIFFFFLLLSLNFPLCLFPMGNGL